MSDETPPSTPAAETPPPAPSVNPPAAETVSPADIVRPLSQEETRGATETPRPAPAAPASTGPNPFAGVKDSLGREFDPAVFRMKNGQPQTDTRGRFVPAGLGRRTGAAASSIGGAETPAAPGAAVATLPAAPAPPDEYHLAAQAACRALYALGMLIGGQDEWMPSDDEHANMVNAAEAYFRAKQFKDVPPGLALAIAVAGYVAPRLSKPKTLGRIERFRLWWVSRSADRRAAHVAELAGRASP